MNIVIGGVHLYFMRLQKILFTYKTSVRWKYPSLFLNNTQRSSQYYNIIVICKSWNHVVRPLFSMKRTRLLRGNDVTAVYTL